MYKISPAVNVERTLNTDVDFNLFQAAENEVALSAPGAVEVAGAGVGSEGGLSEKNLLPSFVEDFRLFMNRNPLRLSTPVIICKIKDEC